MVLVLQKKSVTDDLVKDYMYLSEPFSDFFSSSCFVSLQICVTSAQSCSKTLWCLWIRLRVFHLPSTSCCQRQTVPLPNRRQEFRHLSEGKIRFWVSVTLYKPCLLCLQGLASVGQGLRTDQCFESSSPKRSRRNPFQKPQCSSSKTRSFRSFTLGISKNRLSKAV